jgi:NAD(P) transhydrogenase
MADFEYDLVVIGSGPAGQRAAIQGVKLRKRVAIIERKTVVGGVCINTGTIPSKTLREAVLHPTLAECYKTAAFNGINRLL